MKISQSGLDIIKEFEGLKLQAYAATEDERKRGIWTIGYGSTYWPDGRKVKQGDNLTDAKQAETLLRTTVEQYEKAVSGTVKVHLTQNQFDALVSFAFNIGISAFKGSTLVKILNKTDITPVADQLLVWNKQSGKVLNGLVRRREMERSLFLS
jgi:lysozyme